MTFLSVAARLVGKGSSPPPNSATPWTGSATNFGHESGGINRAQTIKELSKRQLSRRVRASRLWRLFVRDGARGHSSSISYKIASTAILTYPTTTNRETDHSSIIEINLLNRVSGLNGNGHADGQVSAKLDKQRLLFHETYPSMVTIEPATEQS
jgi:hypothetical protein